MAYEVQESDYHYGELVWLDVSTHDTQDGAIAAFAALLDEGREQYSLRVYGPEGVVEWPRWDVRLRSGPATTAQICQLVTRADAELALKNFAASGLWPAADLSIVETTET